ncbi:MAG: radical SAM protein [Bacteroidales bacterium]|jgi:radical SAM superfamily enzyme YgiQ (UPF0313 family)|nr:B12-binding domain-containing radical SAM protein [Bacteroidales bacterium]MDD4214062.1 radical SAM protein [Bacteroidales bacterium]
MKKKLLLIGVVDLESYSGRKNVLPITVIKSWQPIQFGIIAAITPDDWEIDMIDEYFEPFSFRKADLVGISASSTSINRAYRIAQIFKKENIPVVIGGMHASFYPEEASQYVDIVAVGKAEGVWQNILNDFNNKALKKIYYSDPDVKVIFKPKRDIFKKYGYSIGNIISSIGCPNKCDFCNRPIFQNYKYHLRNVDEIVDEIKEIEQHYFIFNDDNFFGTTDKHIERTVELFNKMIKAKIKKRWLCHTSVNITKYPEVLKLAGEAGCVSVFVGLESFDIDELLQFSKHTNKKYVEDDYKSAIKVFHKNKMPVSGAFICGGEKETLESIVKKAHAIRNTKLDNIVYSFLTPLPKTPLFEKYFKEGKLLYTNFPEDWIYYNFFNVTFKTEHGSPEQFFDAYLKTMGIIYGHHKGLIKDDNIYRFFLAILNTRSVKNVIDFHIFQSFYNLGGYRSVFWKIMFKLRRPKITFNR